MPPICHWIIPAHVPGTGAGGMVTVMVTGRAAKEPISEGHRRNRGRSSELKRSENCHRFEPRATNRTHPRERACFSPAWVIHGVVTQFLALPLTRVLTPRTHTRLPRSSKSLSTSPFSSSSSFSLALPLSSPRIVICLMRAAERTRERERERRKRKNAEEECVARGMWPHYVRFAWPRSELVKRASEKSSSYIRYTVHGHRGFSTIRICLNLNNRRRSRRPLSFGS